MCMCVPVFYFAFLFLRFYFIFIYVYLCVCAHVSRFPWRSEEGMGSLELEFTGGCELPDRRAGN